MLGTYLKRVIFLVGAKLLRRAAAGTNRRSREAMLFLIAGISALVPRALGPVQQHTLQHRAVLPRHSCSIRLRAEDEGDEFQQRFDRLLDTPIIDPLQVDRPEDPQLLRSFRALARDDYQMAETIWAGATLGIALVAGQELVRLYKHNVFDVLHAQHW